MYHQLYIVPFNCTYQSIILLQFCFSHELKPGEYGLSEDLDVALWLDCRALQCDTPVPEIQDFVIIDSQLHDQFDLFKKSNVRESYSLIPLCNLLTFHCHSGCKCHHSLNLKVEKYGKVYLELHMRWMN